MFSFLIVSGIALLHPSMGAVIPETRFRFPARKSHIKPGEVHMHAEILLIILDHVNTCIVCLTTDV